MLCLSLQNNFTMFFRNNHSHLRTVHFQFMERPENVTMLRALMNNEVPQNNKKVPRETFVLAPQ